MIRHEYTRAQWVAELTRWGCKPAEGIAKQRRGEWWRFPTPGLYPFFVSYDEREVVDGWAVIRLVDGIKQQCPDASPNG